MTLEEVEALRAYDKANPRAHVMGRLVGNARCNACGQFRPEVVAFDVRKNGSAAVFVCDECLTRAIEPNMQAARVDAALKQVAALREAAKTVLFVIVGDVTFGPSLALGVACRALDAAIADATPAAEALERRVRASVWMDAAEAAEVRGTSERITADRAHADGRLSAYDDSVVRADLCQDLAARFRARAREMEKP